MIPAAFDYKRATSLDEAVAILAANENAKVIAGGQSILPLMKLRLANPGLLVDIGRVPGLRGIRSLPDGRLAVGALTTYRELLDHGIHYGLLQDALPTIGDVQVRNRGTIGGAVAHADPASDLPACLLALDAELVARGPGGERRIPAAEFFQSAFVTALRQDEILTEVILPAPVDGAGSAYSAIEQPASGYAMAGVAAVVVRGGPGGPIVFARIGVTGVHEHAYRADDTEAALVGSDGSADAIAAAAARITDAVEVNSDIHADAEYRAAMAVVHAQRAIAVALSRI